LALGCSDRASRQQQLIDEVFGTMENFELMRTAGSVRVCRLTLAKPVQAEDGPEYQYLEGPYKDVSKSEADRCRALLADDRSYIFESTKACPYPIYAVRLRFEKAGETVDVSLCFKCGDLEVRRNGKVAVPGYDYGHDFGPAHAKLLSLCQKLFPDDAELQKVSPH
jgi:hypothetical protein